MSEVSVVEKILGNGLTLNQTVKRIAEADSAGDAQTMMELARGLSAPEHRQVALEFRGRSLGVDHPYSKSLRSKDELLKHIDADHRRRWQLPRGINITQGFLAGFHKTIHGEK